MRSKPCRQLILQMGQCMLQVGHIGRFLSVNSIGQSFQGLPGRFAKILVGRLNRRCNGMYFALNRQVTPEAQLEQIKSPGTRLPPKYAFA